MVKSFHDQGLKVYIDVVFNHTGEGGLGEAAGGVEAKIFGWRGLDNASYYELRDNAAFYANNNGVSPNFNTANPVARNLIMDSLSYWTNDMGN